jgi:hypothetical protein
MNTRIAFYFLLVMALFTRCEVAEDPETNQDIDPPVFVLNEASSITTTTAFVSGNVTGEDIQETGFIYNTSLPLVENSLRESLGMNMGDVQTSLNGLSPNTQYYFALYAENGDGEFFQSGAKSFVTEEEIVLALGDVYEGGIIYYLDNTGEHGLLVSPDNITEGSNWETAIAACNSYVLEENSDWRMPDIDELEDLYAQKDIVGGFADIAYWSSSVEGSNTTLAYGVYFGGGQYAGQTFVYDKTGTYQYSRAIRAF